MVSWVFVAKVKSAELYRAQTPTAIGSQSNRQHIVCSTMWRDQRSRP